MLVLTRKRSERTFIDVPPSTHTQRIAVVIVDIVHGKARLGIEAAPEVSIARDDMNKTPHAA